MWMKQILCIYLVTHLVAGQIPPCPSNSAITQNTSRLVNSCEALNGRCIDTRCQNCNNGELSDDLCQNHGGDEIKCCRKCPIKPMCMVENPGYFTTYYGKRFNFQESGSYVLSKDCGNGLWSVEIDLRARNDKTSELIAVNIEVGDVIVKLDYPRQRFSVTQGGSPITSTFLPYTFGDVTVSNVKTYHHFFVLADFFGVRVVGNFLGRYLQVTPGYTNKRKTCGLCGAISEQPTDFTTDPHQLAIQNDIDVVHNDCPYAGKPADQKKCKDRLMRHARHCTGDFYSQKYLQACSFGFCMGSAGTALQVLKDFLVQCFPLEYGTCTMTGHTFYETFDKLSYQFQAKQSNVGSPPCSLVMVKDCKNNTFSVEVTHVESGAHTEVEKVTINLKGGTIDLIASGKQVKVNGATMAVPHNSLDIEATVYYHDGGDVVTVAALNGNLVVDYNFHQLVTVHLQPEYYKKTCGMCGVWNDNPSDDRRINLPSGCAELHSPGCRPDQQAAARKACQSMFQTNVDNNCHTCYNPNRIEICMFEYCLQSQKGLCEHAQEFSDGCYLKQGEDLPKPGYC